jgi:uncharacterized iron-regulated protein
MNTHRIGAWATALIMGVGLAGCASAPRDAPSTPARDGGDLLVGVGIGPGTARGVPITGPDGQAVPWDRLVRLAADSDVVLIGETHGHRLGLASAAALFDDLAAPSMGLRPVLALEFFERDEQAALDDLLTGVSDEPAMLRATGKLDPASYPPGHRAMILTARERGLSVIAANAPRRYVRLARTEGYDRLAALTPEQRRLFDLPDREASVAYRAAFDAVMDAMAGLTESQRSDATFMAERRRTLDATFRSQWLWDWTMATSVARAMPLGRPVVLVVGRFHVESDGGTLQAVRAQRPDARVVRVVFSDAPGLSPDAPPPGEHEYRVRLGPLDARADGARGAR